MITFETIGWLITLIWTGLGTLVSAALVAVTWRHVRPLAVVGAIVCSVALAGFLFIVFNYPGG